jgi:hypothetical protein
MDLITTIIEIKMFLWAIAGIMVDKVIAQYFKNKNKKGIITFIN